MPSSADPLVVVFSTYEQHLSPARRVHRRSPCQRLLVLHRAISDANVHESTLAHLVTGRTPTATPARLSAANIRVALVLAETSLSEQCPSLPPFEREALPPPRQHRRPPEPISVCESSTLHRPPRKAPSREQPPVALSSTRLRVLARDSSPRPAPTASELLRPSPNICLPTMLASFVSYHHFQQAPLREHTPSRAPAPSSTSICTSIFYVHDDGDKRAFLTRATDHDANAHRRPQRQRLHCCPSLPASIDHEPISPCARDPRHCHWTSLRVTNFKKVPPRRLLEPGGRSPPDSRIEEAKESDQFVF